MSLIVSSPVGAAVFWTTYLAFIALDAALVTRVLAGHVVPDGQKAVFAPVHRTGGILWLIAGEAFGLALALVPAFVLPWGAALLVAGVALAWAGTALRWWAKRKLGRFFVGAIVIQEDHHVVREGPYALVRHPGYAGSILALLGLGLATGNIATVVVFATLSYLIFVRTIALEESTLRAELGAEYADYARTTARLVPGVW